MSRVLTSSLLVAMAASAFAAKKHNDLPMPTEFEIGRHTFFDFGPPFDYYELLVVHPAPNGASIERVTLSPPADVCFRSAQVETASATISESISEVFGKTNPCAIPAKELRRELKRCKKCLTFSGANVSIRVQCGAQVRIIRADILDRDMFDPAPKTPQHTSWTMQLLQKLDQAVGPDVMEKPVFPGLGTVQPAAPVVNSRALEKVGSGEYDSLFIGAPDKPSEIYKAAQKLPPTPVIRLVSSSPIEPLEFISPVYPRLAHMANASGRVTVSITVGEKGTATDVSFKSGSQLFRGVTEEAVRNWKFPASAVSRQVEAILDFNTNCVGE